MNDLTQLSISEIDKLIEQNKAALTPENRGTVFAQMTLDMIQNLENTRVFKEMFPG